MESDVIAAVEAVEDMSGGYVSYHDLSGALIPLLGRSRRLHAHAFCRAVKRAHEGRCMRFDVDMVRRTMTRSSNGFWKSCHAGVCEYVQPVGTFGILFIGPFTSRKKISCALSQQKGTAVSTRHVPLLRNDASIAALLSMIAREMLRRIAENSPASDRRRAVERFFSQRSCDDVHYTDLADTVGISGSRARQLVRTWYGRSFTRVITENRMRRACYLLASTEMPVRDIARSVGYADTDYFFKVFRKFTGATPLSYRKEQSIHRAVRFF